MASLAGGRSAAALVAQGRQCALARAAGRTVGFRVETRGAPSHRRARCRPAGARAAESPQACPWAPPVRVRRRSRSGPVQSRSSCRASSRSLTAPRLLSVGSRDATVVVSPSINHVPPASADLPAAPSSERSPSKLGMDAGSAFSESGLHRPQVESSDPHRPLWPKGRAWGAPAPCDPRIDVARCRTERLTVGKMLLASDAATW